MFNTVFMQVYANHAILNIICSLCTWHFADGGSHYSVAEASHTM
jgi:hypothetical protein